MQYRTVELEEKTVVGLSARTSNSTPDMGEIIGGLWRKFYSSGCCGLIGNRSDAYALGIYTDYENDENGSYTVMTACSVTNAENIPKGCKVIKIPAGKYAEFSIEGDMDTQSQLAEVQKLWQEIWQCGLDRAYVCDFEEYRSSDPDKADIHIFIGLK